MSKQPPKALLAGVLTAGLLASPLAALPAAATTTDPAPGKTSSTQSAGAAESAPAAATPEVLPAAPGTETISILSFNDFHGALSDDFSGTQFADTVEDYRAEFAAVHGDDRVLLTSAGDLIGASASVSNVQQDEPTIEIMNALGLAVSAAGNHEFDKGLDDLRDRVLPLADFEFVAANFVDPTTREPVLPSHEIFDVGGVKVAVIGAVPNNLYATTTGAGLEGNDVIDLVEGVNTVAAELEAAGTADIIVASYHDGASGNGVLSNEIASSEVFQSIVQDTDPSVDVIFNGHTHQTYNYETTAGSTERPVVQAGQSGTKLAAVELQIDTSTKEVVTYSSELIDRSTQAPADAAAESPVTAEVYALEQAAVAEFKVLLSTVIGEIDASITTDYQTRITENGAWRAGGTRRAETTLGNWAATAIKDRVSLTNPEVDLGVTNAGGLRAELLYDKFTASGQFTDKPADLHGKVTLGEILDFAPFGNTLVYFDIPGSSIKQVLEENWQNDKRTFTLGWSEDLTWTYDDSRAQGDHVTGIWIDGEPVQMDQMYTVGTLSFLADTAYLGSGSSAPDGYAGFAQGRENFVDLGIADNQAFQEYVQAQTAAEGSIKPDFSKLGVEILNHTELVVKGQDLSLSLANLELESDGAGDAVRVDVAFEGEDGSLTELGHVTVPAEGESANLTSILAPQTAGTGELVMTVTYDDKYASTTVVRAPLVVADEAVCTAADFSDNPAGSQFYAPVRWMQCAELSTGYTDGTYRKARDINRGETVTLLQRYVDPLDNAPYDSPFSDVLTGHTYYGPITWAAAQGIASGYADQTFRPYRPVSRGEFASFLYRAVDPEHTAPGSSEFSDVPTSSAHYEAITWLAAEGITTGYRDGSFRPTQQVTRGEVAAFLYRYEHLVAQQD